MEKFINIDYLTATCKDEITNVIKILNYDIKEYSEIKGIYSYNTRLLHSNTGIQICFNSDIKNDKNGIHIIASGQTLEKIGAIELINKLFFLKDIKFKRIDLNLDIKNDNALKYISKKLKDHDYKARAKKIKSIKEYATADNKILSTTFYIGSRTSDYMIRIYDKGAEQKTNEDICRIEQEFKNEQANKIVNDIRKNNEKIKEICLGCLKNNFNLLKKRIEPVSRSKIDEKWKNYISYNDIEIYKSAIKKQQSDIEKKTDWIKKQISKSYTICRAAGTISEQNLLNIGTMKMSQNDFNEVSNYLSKQKNNI